MSEFRPARFEILPTVIKNLIIINVLCFLAQKTIGSGGMIDMENVFGLHHVKSSLFQPWQIVTHMFLHGDFTHLIYNMFPLWMFGSVLENMWGPKRFITFYFLCGIGAALIQMASLWFQYADLVNQFVSIKTQATPEGLIAFFNEFGLNRDPQSISILNTYLADPGNSGLASAVVQRVSMVTDALISNPTIGASGAVFGVLAAFVYLYPNQLLYLYFLVPIKVKWIGLFYFGSEIVSAYLNNPNDNIAHWAHLGGGLVGFLLVLTWNRANRRRSY